MKPGSSTIFYDYIDRHYFENSEFQCEFTESTEELNEPVWVNAPTVTVNEAGFKNDFQITKWPSDVVIDNPDGSTPTWTSGGVNDPVAYKANSYSPTIFATLAVSYPTSFVAALRVKYAGSVIAERYGAQLHDGSIKIDDLGVNEILSYTVGVTAPIFNWEISYDGGSNWLSIGSTGPHTMYWTYNVPLYSTFTGYVGGYGYPFYPLYDEALQRACDYANGRSDGEADLIRGAINSGLAFDLYYNPENIVVGHPLKAFTDILGSQCEDNANVLRGLLRSIGIDGDVVHIWAGTSSSKVHYTIGSTGETYPTFRVIRPQKDAAPANPHFYFHAVVSRGGTGGLWWDPSYGLSYSTLTFDETAFNSFPQQISLGFSGTDVLASYTCPH